MWSHIFLYDDDKGNKIAIILLDTQGVYDGESTVKDCTFIFALSSLISSVQIYNISQNIQENDLTGLEYFTQHGKMATKESEHKPYQHMQFLIRDWYYDYEFNFGAVGGKQMLDSCVKLDSPNQHAEQKSVRENLNSCFMEMGCFLMPHPGKHVVRNPEFRGQLHMIDDEFKDSLKELAPLILAPENLEIKQICGNTISAKELLHYIEFYVNELSSDHLPEPQTILNANVEVNHKNVLEEATDLYIDKMKEVCDCKEHMSKEVFKAKHEEIANQILHFVSISTFLLHFF